MQISPKEKVGFLLLIGQIWLFNNCLILYYKHF